MGSGCLGRCQRRGRRYRRSVSGGGGGGGACCGEGNGAPRRFGTSLGCHWDYLEGDDGKGREGEIGRKEIAQRKWREIHREWDGR